MFFQSPGGGEDGAIEHGEHEVVRIKTEADLKPYVNEIAENLKFDALNSSQSTPQSLSKDEVMQLYSKYLRDNAHGAVFLLKGKKGVEAMATVRTPTGMGQRAEVEKIMVNGQSGLKAILRPLVKGLYKHLDEMGCREAVIYTDAEDEARDGLKKAIPMGTLSDFFTIQQKKVEGADETEAKIVGERRGK